MSVFLLFGLGGVGVLLLIALAIVITARKLERRDSGQTAEPHELGGRLRRALAGPAEEAASDAASGSTGKQAAKKKNSAVAAVTSAVAALAVILGLFLADDDDEETEAAAAGAPAETELAAGDLHGLMLSPSADAPVVLIVPGSGPTDRDGNNPLGIRAGTYRLLAEGLAERGIASVRVDKHGMYSSKASGDANDVTVESYASDYRAWIDAIRDETGQPCVWMLGHSEGALMVSAAAIGRDDVCGLILVAGMGRKLGPVLREQLAANPANASLLEAANAAIDRIEAGERVETSTLPVPLRALFPEPVQGFLISAFAADPVEQVRLANLPTLVVQGTTDIQITMEDADNLAATPTAELAVIDGMNHVLKTAPANRLANMATYLDPGLPLAPGLVEAIADFILESR